MANDLYTMIKITEKSEEVLDHFLDKFTEEQQEGILQALQWQLQELGIQNQRIALEEFDYGTLLTFVDTPEKIIEMGSVNVENDQIHKDLCIDKEDMERELRNSAILAEQFEMEVEDNIKELDQEQPASFTDDYKLSNLVDVKSMFKDAGLSGKDLERFTKKIDHDSQKAIKHDVKDLKNQITNLYKEIVVADSIAERNGGFTPEFEEERNKMARQLAQLTSDYINKKEYLISGKEKFANTVNNLHEKVSGLVNRTLGKIERGYDALINNGVNGLNKMKDIVSDANDKFKVQGLSAYTSVRSDLMNVDKVVYATDYSVNKALADSTRYLANSLDKAHNYSKNIGMALKNLGRALIGKEQIIPENESKENAVSSYFNSLADGFEDRAKISLAIYNDVKEEQIDLLQQMQVARSEAGLDMSLPIEKRLEQAKERSAKNDNFFKEGFKGLKPPAFAQSAPNFGKKGGASIKSIGDDDGERTR